MARKRETKHIPESFKMALNNLSGVSIWLAGAGLIMLATDINANALVTTSIVLLGFCGMIVAVITMRRYEKGGSK
jgi:hypothetical protein